MRLAIVNLTGGGMSGGYKKYLLNIIPRLLADGRVEEILCIQPATLRVEEWLQDYPGVSYSSCPPFRSGLTFWFHSGGLKKRLKAFNPDLVFVPVERPFAFGNVPIVHMLQNMEPMVKSIPRSPADWLKSKIQLATASKALRHSNRIIAISEFVKSFLVSEWGISDDRIGVVYHGTDAPAVHERPSGIPRGWDGRFLFTAGSIRPARGLEDVIGALKCITTEQGNADVCLVVAGSASNNMQKYRNRLLQHLETEGLACQVRWLGNLCPEEMAWCYSNCLAFVMTSRVEACPNIVLESLAYGCLCISSDSPPMPEMYADAAAYYRSGEPMHLCSAVSEILGLGSLDKVKMKRSAIDRSREFTWDDTARRTLDEFCKLL